MVREAFDRAYWLRDWLRFLVSQAFVGVE